MKKPYRRFLILFFFLIIFVNIAFVSRALMDKETVKQSEVITKFNNKPEITYNVYTKPSVLYSDNKLPEDIGYFGSMIDYITVSIQNQFAGTDQAEIKGDYTIHGVIVGLEPGAEEPTAAWNKEFPVVSKKTFQVTEQNYILSQNANIDYNHYSEFADQIDELTGYDTDHRLRVSMHINYTITTKDGQVSDELHPTLIIPLGEKYFKITKTDIDVKESVISETIEVKAPVDSGKMIAFSAIGVFCFISLFLLLFKTTEPTTTDLRRKCIKRLLKNYGKRLVAVTENIVHDSLSICNVHSMDDMVKISDEIERPIFYVYQSDITDISEFFIIELKQAYLYRITDSFQIND